jgi:hypothetical protein
MFDFFAAALPWVFMGLFVAVATVWIANSKKKSKQEPLD